MNDLLFKILAKGKGLSKKELSKIPERDFVKVHTKNLGGPFKTSFIQSKQGIVTLIFIENSKTGEVVNGFTGEKSDIVHKENLSTYGLTWYVEK